MSKLVSKIFSKYSLLFLSILATQTSFASINPENKSEQKHYSVCLNNIQTFVEKDGWWVLMTNDLLGWNPVKCDPKEHAPKVFQKYTLEKVISQNMKVKEVSEYELWIFIPK